MPITDNSQVIPEDALEEVENSKAKVVASLLMTGSSINAIVSHMKINRYQVGKLMKTEEFRTQLATMSEQMVSVAANTWKGMMQDLVPLAHKALKSALEKGDLKGVEIIIKSLGIDKQVPQVQQGTLQVILPDYAQGKVVQHD